MFKTKMLPKNESISEKVLTFSTSVVKSSTFRPSPKKIVKMCENIIFLRYKSKKLVWRCFRGKRSDFVIVGEIQMLGIYF